MAFGRRRGIGMKEPIIYTVESKPDALGTVTRMSLHPIDSRPSHGPIIRRRQKWPYRAVWRRPYWSDGTWVPSCHGVDCFPGPGRAFSTDDEAIQWLLDGES